MPSHRQSHLADQRFACLFAGADRLGIGIGNQRKPQRAERGVNIFVEVGPGKVLSGILRQIDRSVRCFNVEDSASLRSTIDRIAQARTEPSDN